MSALDPDDTRPPYAQVVDALRQDIEQGTLAPGAKLPTHQQLATRYGVSVGTVKRALGELQGAGLIISRQGQGAFVRTRRTVIDSVPNTFSAEILNGLWVTSYEFFLERGKGTHADITRISPQSSRRVVATNFPPEPRTEGFTPAFRNEIEAQLANRHLVGNWKNASDTRYFGSLHLAVFPGENVMHGYYTAFTDDVTVHAMTWKWVRLDPASLLGVQVQRLTLKEPEIVHALVTEHTNNLPMTVSAVTEEGEQELWS
jgi:DNA-binding transcriptional regulator YhcF (GntR family)